MDGWMRMGWDADADAVCGMRYADENKVEDEDENEDEEQE